MHLLLLHSKLNTGELDRLTLAKMNSPRCGVPDKFRMMSFRKKRYDLVGSAWEEETLKYKISNYPTKLQDRWQVGKAVERAFELWSEVTNLTFVEEEEGGPVHINIMFVKGDHGDVEPFDGPGEAVAHAFPPDNGEIHFDDEENWTLKNDMGDDLFQLATHEIGHSLGLFHSEEESSIMTPFYFYRPNFKLHQDDIRGIQELYGKRDRPLVRKASSQHWTPDLCGHPVIQAATTTGDGRTYFFKGDNYWEILNGKNIAPGYPRPISDDWDGLPGNIDAALTRPNGKTYIFKGSQYWRFENRNMDPEYPKDISKSFSGIPNSIDAAFVRSENGKIYFFKGDNYWRYDPNQKPRVRPEYPKPIRKRWPDLPTPVSAAIQGLKGEMYFFKADQYFEFMLTRSGPAKPIGYSNSNVEWLGCERKRSYG